MVTRTHDNTCRAKTYPDHVALLSTSSLDEPKSYAQASKHSHWVEAMHKELQALQQNKTWTLVPSSLDQNVIGCKWVFKVKQNADGSIERYKARLVAKGFNQQEGIDYFETFSPVVRPTTILLTLALAIFFGWSIR